MIQHKGTSRIQCFPPPPPLPPREFNGDGNSWDDDDEANKEQRTDWLDFTVGFLGYFAIGSLVVTILLSTLASLQLFLEILFHSKE